MPVKKPLYQGFALIEAMVSIVVVAIGILGILGVQMRTLADTQTGVRRAQAIRLVEDLSERAKVNPNALQNIGSYTTGWLAGGASVATPPDCKTSACNAATLAQSDLLSWKQLVLQTLPLADANVFQVSDETATGNKRQLGVMISWRENEKATGTSAENTDYKAIFTPDSTGAAADVACPADRICHLQYIQLTSRCGRYAAGGATQFFCPL